MTPKDVVVYDSRVLRLTRTVNETGARVWLLATFNDQEREVALNGAAMHELATAILQETTGDEYQLWRRVS